MKENKKETPEGVSVLTKNTTTNLYVMQISEHGEFTEEEIREALSQLENTYLRIQKEGLEKASVTLTVRGDSKNATVWDKKSEGFFYCRGFLKGYFEHGKCEVLVKKEYSRPILDKKSYSSFSNAEMQEKLEKQRESNN